MDGSRRSSHSNAYFSGFGKNKRIALFDTLIDSMNEDEILAVLAHEVGHYKLKHIQTGIILGAIQTGIMLFILSFFINNENLFAEKDRVLLYKLYLKLKEEFQELDKSKL